MSTPSHEQALAELREARDRHADEIFDPELRISRCGQQSAHGPHVVRSGPDQPRNCPGCPGWSWTFTPVPKPKEG